MTAVVACVAALSFAPFLGAWFNRGESKGELTGLSGRTQVWTALLAQPRTEVNTLFGYGMSNDSFNGLPIDSSWYSTYLDQGLVGDVIDGAVLLLLFLLAAFSPRGPRRAIALFLVVYCLVASFTETGLGEASPYLLDLAVAMSVLMLPITGAVPGAAGRLMSLLTDPRPGFSAAYDVNCSRLWKSESVASPAADESRRGLTSPEGRRIPPQYRIGGAPVRAPGELVGQSQRGRRLVTRRSDPAEDGLIAIHDRPDRRPEVERQTNAVRPDARHVVDDVE